MAKLGWCGRIGGNCVGHGGSRWLLPADHRARLCEFCREPRSFAPLRSGSLARGEAGRPAADPAVLLSLWLYATLERGSARELERLAQSEAAYRWLAGGVPLNYHGSPTSGRQRGSSRSAFDAKRDGADRRRLISLAAIAVDGTKVRASASNSPSDGEKLLKIEAAVAERLAALKQELSSDPGRRTAAAKPRKSGGARGSVAAAGARAALERLQRNASRAQRSTSRTRPGRSSRGFYDRPRGALHALSRRAIRPAYNAQIAAPRKRDHRLDRGDRPAQRCGPGGPMVDDIARRYGRTPDRLLVDTSYATSENIPRLPAAGRGDTSSRRLQSGCPLSRA